MIKRQLVSILGVLVTTAFLLSGTVSAATLGSRSLSLGSRGQDVREVQRILAQNGFSPGQQDGIFGPRTEQAVVAFQRTVGLPTIGIVGPRTTASLLAHRAIYTVVRGDTLTSIARRKGTTVAELKAANKLESDFLVAGRRIIIPGASTSAVTTPSRSRLAITREERSTLARLVHAEAQGESFLGKVAVAAVVLNRVDDARFPDTIQQVLYQPFQFEPVLNRWIYKPAGEAAYRAVDAALAGQDPSQGAVFFYNPQKAPHTWMATRPVILRIGNHVFMR
ncbi:MAG: cell wall hydrolase [Firmicutes bacterium]|nr:cell wall hydrolase [Dethiobacter sp.]MBS3889577.1 cell wall hydrolase [Bacillota bacterium]MBS4054484.1 cell wall hydrolase [Thermaerobacter sp.]